MNLDTNMNLDINMDLETNMDLDSNMDLDNDSNERVIWNFCIGIPILKKDELYIDADSRKEYFDIAIYEITQELTKMTGGLTYQKCYGTWVNKENKENTVNTVNNTNLIERNYSVTISIIVLPEKANEVYNEARRIISDANITYNLGIIHVQAMKTFGYAEHFIMKEP